MLMHNAIGAKLLQGKLRKSCIHMYMHKFFFISLPLFDEYVFAMLLMMTRCACCLYPCFDLMIHVLLCLKMIY